MTDFNNYWSSSQNDASNAWNQNVGNGGGPDWQNTDNKNNTNHVRPVRGFHHGNDMHSGADRVSNGPVRPLPIADEIVINAAVPVRRPGPLGGGV